MLTLVHTALRRPRLVLFLIGLGTAVLIAGLFRLEVRTDGAALYPRGDATVELTLADRQRFAEPQQIILLATSRPGGPLLASPAGFRWISRIHASLQELPAAQGSGVRSLANLVERPEGRTLAIHSFLDEIPDDPAAFKALLARLDRFAVARGLFLSPDGRTAAFYFFLAPDAPNAPNTERGPVIRELEAWRVHQVQQKDAPFDLRITGPVAAEAVLGEVVLRDLSRLVPLMVAAIALLLLFTLRTPSGVLVPLAQVLATLLWTLGLMGWAGVPVTLVTTILPVLLMAMAMTDEVHLLERMQNRLAATPTDGNPRERLLRVTADAFRDLLSPLVLTSLTTAFGFFSFAGSTMKPLRDFGIFAGTGLMLGMIFTFTLVPALIAVLPPPWSERRARGRGSALAIPAWERFVAGHSRAFAAGGALLLAAAVPGLFRQTVQDSWIDNFDPRSPLVTAERDFNRAFWGSYRLDVVFEGDRRHFWTPEGAALLEDFDRLARRAPHVGGVLGPLLFLEGGALMHGDPLPLSALPPVDVKRAGAAIEALNIRLDLRQYLSADASAARTRLFVRDADFARGRELRDFLGARLGALAARHGVRAHLSGDVPAGLAVVEAIVGNQLGSIGWTAALIAVTLLVSFRSPRWTAVVMAPIAAAILLLFAALGYAGLPLGIATSMFAALTLGAGVDFALHYCYGYRRERRERRAGRDPSDHCDHDGAVLATLATAGRGVLWNALVLAFGFLVLAFSALKPNASLGLLLAAAMAVSYLATVVFLPELLRRWGGDQERGAALNEAAPCP
jgi:predicted RND superfamily exporter protein